jgi:outer membrane murein-binding lipoprotein Lpp
MVARLEKRLDRRAAREQQTAAGESAGKAGQARLDLDGW